MIKSKTSTVPKKQPTPPAPAAAAKADLQPDAAVGVLVLHSERLAKTAATHADELETAKVTPKHLSELTSRIATLRAAEVAWQKARKAMAPGAVTKAREALTLGREDLLGGLRAFAENNEATQRALDAVGAVEDDDDLESDVEVLLPLARAHAAELKGTEITPGHVNGVEKSLTAFRAARAGARTAAGDDTTAQALSKSALSARRARNEAFWALSALNRQVCGRARFCFRRDPKRKALFGSYSTERQGAARKSAPTPAPPTG